MFREFLRTSPWLKIKLPCQDWFHWSETTSQQTLSQAFLVYQIHSGRGTQCQILLTNLLFWHGEAVVHICHINPTLVYWCQKFSIYSFLYIYNIGLWLPSEDWKGMIKQCPNNYLMGNEMWKCDMNGEKERM